MKRLISVILTLHLAVFTAYAKETVRLAEPEVQSAEIGAKAAIVIEAMTGRVMFVQNETDRLPIASTTKILTALMALEQPDIDAVFTVDEDAIRVEGSSMGLQKGDKASLRALTTGMLLASGNDAANAAAVRIAGSIPAFVEMMNARAKEMGLEDTSFETPSGLDGDNHYSTARDLARLTQEALRNDEFRAICSQYKMRTSFGNPPYDRWLTNHNKLLNYYGGAIGVKTGFTKKAGRCLVSAARRDGIELICVTLDCPNDWNVHETLYERLFGKIQIEDLSKGIPGLTVPVTGGKQAEVSAVKADVAQVPVPTEAADIEYQITLEQFLYAPVRKGQYLGEARIFVDGEQVSRVSLIAGRDVPLLNQYEEEKNIINILKGLFKKD